MKISELYYNKGFEYYPTDKGIPYHSYISIYDDLFEKFENEKINIFEVGIYWGGSIRLWSDYFKMGTIIGCDIIDITKGDIMPENSIKMIKNVNTISSKEFENYPLTIAIDDGSHTLFDQLNFVKIFYPLILNGGLLIVEDIQNIDIQKKDFDLLNFEYEVIDLRNQIGRYDDVLLVFRKNKLNYGN